MKSLFLKRFCLLIVFLYIHFLSIVQGTSLDTTVAPQAGAFVTIFYDYGEDSEAMMLAIRVLMRSIRNSKTIYRKIIIIPHDGIQNTHREQLRMDDSEIEIFRSEIPNVFIHTSITDPRAQLRHARNKLVLWDNPVLSKLIRFVYVDPENLLISNLDEIFTCTSFCAVDNGQSIVYSNSLLVITPANVAARNLYSDAIDAFMISGREYDYVGISQGFLPGLFEALEESPLFSVPEEIETIKEEKEDKVLSAFERDASTSVVRRLPFYYSINHMVFYERLNWDLYRCKDKGKGLSTIPGPLLSFKYSGHTIKPWFWLAYAYFQVNWHWQEVRESLEEDHVSLFISKLCLQSVLYITAWYACVTLCLKLRSEPSGRMRRLSSSNWGLPAPSNVPPHSRDLLNSRVVRKVCQLTCNVLIGVSSMPYLSSTVTVGVIMWTSIYSIPPTMHPRYACILWAFLLNSLVMTILIVYKITYTFRTAEWARGKVPSSMSLLMEVVITSIQQMHAFVLMEMMFIYVIGRTDWFQNPVLRPIVLLSLLFILMMVQIRLIAKEMTRVGAV